jgi:hypothetical protein
MEATEFIIINDSKKEVTVYLTLELSESYVTDINQIPFITKKINPFQGSFQLTPQKFVYFSTPKGMVFGGTVSFESLPINCPIPSFPFGVNKAEFVLNNHLDYPKTYESVKINNASGANALMKLTLKDGGKWTERLSECGENFSFHSTIKKTLSDCSKKHKAYDSITLDMGQMLKRSDENYEKSLMAKRPASDAGGLVALTYLGQAHA